MYRLLLLNAVVLFSLACGATLQENNLPDAVTQAPTVTPTSEPIRNQYVVTAETLRIRNGAGESFPLLGYLENGQIVTCFDTATAKDGGLWCKHELGWSNTRYMKGY